MNDEKFKDTLQACFYGDKGAYNKCMYEFQHRGLMNDKLQSNWNSLREYYKRKAEETKDSTSLYDKWTKYSSVVDKMNELEGVTDE